MTTGTSGRRRAACGRPGRADPAAPVRAGSRLDGTTLLAIFAAQAESRHLDFAARWMQRRRRLLHHQLAGHEGNAALAAALRPTTGAAALPVGRVLLRPRRPAAGHDPLRDVLLGVVAAADEPIAGGRHKVFGHAGSPWSRRPRRSPRTCQQSGGGGGGGPASLRRIARPMTVSAKSSSASQCCSRPDTDGSFRNRCTSATSRRPRSSRPTTTRPFVAPRWLLHVAVH